MANCDCENDYKLFESELKITKPAAAYLSGISKQHWVKYVYQDHFKLPTYGETTSNLAEQSNNWIGNKCRSAKPLDAFGLYFRKLSELVSSKRQLAAAWLDKRQSTTLVPQLAKKREDLIKAAGSCQITPCLAGAYDVLYLGPTAEEGYIHPWRLVDLPGAECTCGNWQDTDFPCVHAVAAAIKDGRDLDTLYDAEKMSIGYFKETYNVSFKPWPIDVILEKDTGLLVPAIQENPRENGKRGLKPGPKPKHKRKKTKGAE
ncbi:SWIM zinc finger domain-containing protein [Phytophthora infestans]|uniref:SWIM zinc finger domain-containing protein n=1 Tax=Phytophthora infestans TaxID=4787 RepID=A0A8S9V1P7_PHYIN|nr:SWIM zinc finger domain-containing protein [Phytophthora infestans]